MRDGNSGKFKREQAQRKARSDARLRVEDSDILKKEQAKSKKLRWNKRKVDEPKLLASLEKRQTKREKLIGAKKNRLREFKEATKYNTILPHLAPADQINWTQNSFSWPVGATSGIIITWPPIHAKL